MEGCRISIGSRKLRKRKVPRRRKERGRRVVPTGVARTTDEAITRGDVDSIASGYANTSHSGRQFNGEGTGSGSVNCASHASPGQWILQSRGARGIYHIPYIARRSTFASDGRSIFFFFFSFSSNLSCKIA